MGSSKIFVSSFLKRIKFLEFVLFFFFWGKINHQISAVGLLNNSICLISLSHRNYCICCLHVWFISLRMEVVTSIPPGTRWTGIIDSFDLKSWPYFNSALWLVQARRWQSVRWQVILLNSSILGISSSLQDAQNSFCPAAFHSCQLALHG